MESQEIQERVSAVNDRSRLNWNLDEMRKSERKWLECLKDIHDKKLYRHDYPSFEEFCKKQLGIARRTAYDALQAQDMKALLIQEAPEIEAQVLDMSRSSLVETARLEPEKRVQVVRSIAQTGAVTMTKIKAASKPKEKKAEAREVIQCPHCGHLV